MKTDALFYLEILRSVDARFFVKSQGSWKNFTKKRNKPYKWL